MRGGGDGGCDVGEGGEGGCEGGDWDGDDGDIGMVMTGILRWWKWG